MRSRGVASDSCPLYTSRLSLCPSLCLSRESVSATWRQDSVTWNTTFKLNATTLSCSIIQRVQIKPSRACGSAYTPSSCGVSGHRPTVEECQGRVSVQWRRCNVQWWRSCGSRTVHCAILASAFLWPPFAWGQGHCCRSLNRLRLQQKTNSNRTVCLINTIVSAFESCTYLSLVITVARYVWLNFTVFVLPQILVGPFRLMNVHITDTACIHNTALSKCWLLWLPGGGILMML